MFFFLLNKKSNMFLCFSYSLYFSEQKNNVNCWVDRMVLKTNRTILSEEFDRYRMVSESNL